MGKEKFIDIEKLLADKNPTLAKWLPGFILSYIKKILHENEVNDFIAKNTDLPGYEWCEAVVEYLGFDIEIHGLENIPKDGPIIIAMNHPLGGIDAIALIVALKGQREDLKFIVNDLLMNLTNLQGYFVGVNKHGKNNISSRQQVMNVFETNKAVCVFPAGLVSRKQNGVIRDLEWKKTFVSFSKKLNQQIIPVFIDGKLSNFFYRLANFRKFLGIKTNIEMLYLVNELYKQKGKTITFTVGKPLFPETFDPEVSDKDLSQQIKEKVYSLSLQK